MDIKMPKMEPIVIPTKDLGFWAATWLWMCKTRRWRITVDWFYQLDSRTMIVIPKGFEFDGASVPKVFRGMLSPTGLYC